MKTKLSTSQAAAILIDDQFANWSHAGAHALVKHLEEFEELIGEELQFDPVVIRCDFSEYESLQAWMLEFWGDIDTAFDALGHYAEDGEDELLDKIRDYIHDRGDLIEFNGGVIVRDF